MIWPLLAGAALGAIQGDQQRRAQQDANRQQANMSAAQAEFSPWTGIKPSTPQFQAVSAGPLSGALQGGLTGAMFANSMKGAPGGMDEMSDMDLQKSDPAAYLERQKARGF